MRPTVKLGEICDIERGGSPRPIQEFLTTDENGVNWIKIGDTKTQPKYIEFTQEKIKPEGVKHSRMVYPGDFVLSNSMSFGRPYIMKTSGCIHDGRLVLRPDNRIDKEFLYYLLGSDFMYKKFELTASGSGVKNLNIDKVKVVEIPLPPLETQKAIVAKLDQIFAELDQTKSEIQKNLDNTDELWKSALNQSFQGDWEMKKLGEVIKLVSGQDLTTKEYNSLGNGIPYITGASNIENESIIINRWTEFPKSMAKEGDLLITVKGTVGTMAILHEPKVHIARQIMAIENEEATTILYIKLFLETYIQKLKNSANGLIPGISRDTILNIQIPFPPLSEQEKIVEHLDQVSKEVKALKSQYQSQLDNLEELKKSVLDKAFRGEIGE